MSFDLDAQTALERLLDGNRKFSAGSLCIRPSRQDIFSLKDGQHPFAAILSCADSRVPPELVFGCSLGELFVVRTAGNIVSHLEAGSLEYAVTQLGVRLVLVLGHSNCGAVAGALNGIQPGGTLEEVLACITPSVKKARAEAGEEALVSDLAENYNIRNTVALLRKTPALRAASDTLIVGAKYNIATGEVALLPDE